MIVRVLLILSFIASVLSANKVIYSHYEQVPQRVVKGQIFEVTLKTLSTIKNFESIHYSFSNHDGIEVLNTVPYRVQKGKFFYDTFKLYLRSSNAKLPDIQASLITNWEEYEPTTIVGKKLNIITLNPRKDFSNVIADSFALKNYKTTSYDNKHNIVIFSAIAKNSMLKSMHFKNVFKQGRESLAKSSKNAEITYFVVIDKKHTNFSFSYFNIVRNKFVNLDIPIVVEDDSVTTQTDLKPTNQSHEKIKLYIAATFGVFLFIISIVRKKYIYIIFALIPAGYIYFSATPQQDVCIKQDVAIHLLPVDNGTIFEITKSQISLPKEGNVERYIKVKLENEKIGWVKNEDTCSN